MLTPPRMLRISVQHLAAGRVELLNKVYRCHNRVATSATQIKAAVLGEAIEEPRLFDCFCFLCWPA